MDRSRSWFKRKLITFGRISDTGFHNFFRSLWLTTAATAIMVVTLTIMFGSVVIHMALNETIKNIEQDISFSVYLKDNLTDAQRDPLRQRIEQDPNVVTVSYISKEQALANFRDRFKDNPEVLKSVTVTDNVLPASFEVKLKDLTKEDSVLAITQAPEFKDAIDSVDDNKTRRDAVNEIVGLKRFATRAGVIAGSIFGIISILIIFNTIRMAIYTRSYEIEIMKLIGATPGYIRGPFLFEAALYGLIAGIISFVLVYSTLLTLGPGLQRSNKLEMTDTIAFFSDHWWLTFLALTGLGMLIGLISSSVSMARYLRLRRW